MTGFDDPKVSGIDPKMGRDLVKHLSKLTVSESSLLEEKHWIYRMDSWTCPIAFLQHCGRASDPNHSSLTRLKVSLVSSRILYLQFHRRLDETIDWKCEKVKFCVFNSFFRKILKLKLLKSHQRPMTKCHCILIQSWRSRKMLVLWRRPTRNLMSFPLKQKGTYSIGQQLNRVRH